MSQIHHFKGFSIVEGGIDITVNLDRLSRQFNEAQYWLDGQVMEDMVPYMPIVTGSLIQRTRARSASMQGTGKVCAGAGPYGRFQYMGKVMIDPVTGSPFARPGAKKVVTDRDLKYGNPRATAKWFDTAKLYHGDYWVKGVKKRAGGN